ncbi:MAG: hypothetical protein WBP12_03340 [Candidatus Saccharimonas sp.]
MDPLTLWLVVIIVILVIGALFLRKRRDKKAIRAIDHSHDLVAYLVTELDTASSTNDIERVRSNLQALKNSHAHWQTCSECTINYIKPLIERSEQQVSDYDLGVLWNDTGQQTGHPRIAALSMILSTAKPQNVWFDTIPGGRAGIVTSLVDEIQQWIVSITALTPDTVKWTKSSIEKYIAVANNHQRQISFPSNWNDMVARDIATPKPKYFINVPELDFRQFVHTLRRAVREHDTTTLAMLAAIAIEGDDEIDEKLIHYLLVECTQEQPPIDAIDLVKLLGNKPHAQPVNR